MKFKHLVEYLFLVTFCIIVRSLPLKINFFIINIIADITFFVFKIRRKVVIENLKIAFGNSKSLKEIHKIARNVYKNFGKTVIEVILLDKYSFKKLKRIVKIYNKEIIDKALSRGKGAIIVSGHLGNWELMGVSLLAFGYPVSFVVGRQKNELVDSLLNSFRKNKGINLIPRDKSMKEVLRRLKNNELVAILSDQSAIGGISVNFFGKPASTPQGAARFALKADAGLICAVGVPDEKREIHNLYVEEVKVELTGDKEKDVFLLTEAFTKKLENYISKYPEHYFWLHRRWKR